MIRGNIYRIFFISIFTSLLFYSSNINSQQIDSSQVISSTNKSTESIKFGGYVDAYYAHYSDSVGTNNYQKIPDISPKDNQFSLNIVQITAQYSTEKIRAIATFHYGDLPSSAWSPVFNLIQEANAGIQLSKKIWLDAGFFKTHIGTEALLPKDNITSSLSVITFYEPWWQAGIKLSYVPNNKWLICLHILNGYNTFEDNNNSKSTGITLTYALSDKGSIGYYNLIGEESPYNKPKNHLRFLNNLVFNYQLSNDLKVIVGVDYITQQHSQILDSNKTASIYSGILTLKYQLSNAFGIYGREEIFSDKDGFLTGQITDSNLKSTGYVLNGTTFGMEYKPLDNAYIRLEGRELVLDSKQKIFRTNGINTNIRIEAMINFGVSF